MNFIISHLQHADIPVTDLEKYPELIEWKDISEKVMLAGEVNTDHPLKIAKSLKKARCL